MKKPEFLEPLKDQVLKEGVSIRLQTRFSAEPEAHVTWLRNDVPLQQSAIFRMTTQGDVTCLDINGVQAEDSGTYTVVARNVAGEARASCNVRVESTRAPAAVTSHAHAPVIKMGLRSQEVKEGNRAKLECTVTANPPPQVQLNCF